MSEKRQTSNQPALEREKDLTPPHGDELRGEVTFGRTDRYANVDDEHARREQPVEDPGAGTKSTKDS